MAPPSRRRFLQAVGGLSGIAAGGCLAAPSAPEEPPAEPPGKTTTSGVTPTPAEPSGLTARRGGASVELHPRRAIAFPEELAPLRCACAAADAVEAHVYGRLDETRGLGVGCGRPPATRDGDFAVTVHHRTTHDRDGDLIREPAVTYDRLRALTPRSASATIVDGDREHVCTVPVYVVHTEAYVD